LIKDRHGIFKEAKGIGFSPYAKIKFEETADNPVKY
jgi:hypothetical protein